MKACGYVDGTAYGDNVARLGTVLRNIDPVIEKTKTWFEAVREEFVKCEKCYVLGYGANVGTAMEGALKEHGDGAVSLLWFETEEFLHGPWHP